MREQGVEGVTYPPTHWKCGCGRRYIGDVRYFAHADRATAQACQVGSGWSGGEARHNREQERRRALPEQSPRTISARTKEQA